MPQLSVSSTLEITYKKREGGGESKTCKRVLVWFLSVNVLGSCLSLQMSEQWYSANEDLDSESDKEERDWVQERARSMSRGRGSVRPSDRPAQVGRDIPYVGGGNPVKRSCMWENPCSCPASEEGCRRLRLCARRLPVIPV